MWHVVTTAKEGDGKHPIWGFNGSLDRPTFTPSVYVSIPRAYNQEICHSFVRDGKIEYLTDSTHHLAGSTVEMVDLPLDGKESN